MINRVNATEKCAQILKKLVEEKGKVLNGGILKVDSFLNHQIDPELMQSVGKAIAEEFDGMELTKIVTVESSGIAPAMSASIYLGIPLIFVRKKQPITMRDYIKAKAPSHTKGGITELFISREVLNSKDKILIVDDFLASGKTIEAVVNMILSAGAELKGIVGVIEKTFEGGRKKLTDLNVPIVSMVKIRSLNGRVEFEE